MSTPGQGQGNNKKNSAGTSRRGFLKMGAAGAAAGILAGIAGGRRANADDIPVPKADAVKFSGGEFPKGPIAASGRVIGANDRILCAVIGCGGQGFGAHVKGVKSKSKDNNTELIGCSDLFKPRLERAQKEMTVVDGRTIQAEKDYRRILDNKDIDTVFIATPEHWHAQIAVHAMEAGKHVYVEKPMTRYLDEAFQVMDAQKRTGKLLQLGIQATSDPKWHAIGDSVKAGKIGQLVSGQSSYCRNSGKDGEWNYKIEDASLDNLDWEIWQGSAAKRPWNDDSKERFFRFRKFWDYSCGILSDLMPHKLGPFLISCGNPEFPIRVCSIGTRKISLDREVDDTVEVLAEFPSGWTMIFTGSTVNEQGLPDVLRGHKATIYMGGDGAKALPERPFSEEVEEFQISKATNTGIPDHHRNLFEAIRSGTKLNCDAEFGAKVQCILALAEMSSRTNKTMLFDPATRVVRAG